MPTPAFEAGTQNLCLLVMVGDRMKWHELTLLVLVLEQWHQQDRSPHRVYCDISAHIEASGMMQAE